MDELEQQTQKAFGGASGSWGEEPLTLRNVPEFERPMMAAEDDVWTGITNELGERQFATKTGQTYFVSLNPDQRTTRTKVTEDVIPAVKDYLKEPKMPSKEQALGFGKAVAEGAYNSLESAVSGTGTLGDVYGAAGMAATGGLGTKVPEGATRIFGGKRAENPGYVRGGRPAPESVGAEGMWRFEIPDNELVVIPSNFDKVNAKDPTFSADKISTTLPDVIIHDELFSQYPFLEKQKIFIDSSLENTNTLGYHDNSTGLMALSPALLKDPEKLKGVLLHEIQHPVQRFEGFTPGTNTLAPEVEGPAKTISKDRVATEKKLREDYEKKLEEVNSFDFEEGFIKLEDKLRNFVEGSGLGWNELRQNKIDVLKDRDLWNLQRQINNIGDDYWRFRESSGKGNRFARETFVDNLTRSLTYIAETIKKDPNFSSEFKKSFGLEPKEFLTLREGPSLLEGTKRQAKFLEDLGVVKIPPAKTFYGSPADRVTYFDREEAYRRKSGEVEARNVEARQDLTLEGRFKIPPEATEDVPRSKQWFAKGGLTKDKQMNKLFAEGGINTGNAEIDPISGNEVPPGSMPEEVRDDIDAKLSGGEYVVPADVLRFYGVSFFEKLRKKAKEGLAEMDSDGRIGGGFAPEKEEEDDFPFSMEELESEDEMEMAEGGLTENKTPASFNPTDWAFGGTTFGSGSSSAGANQMKQYLDKQGNIVNVLFINGKPIVDVEALGYTEYTGDNTPKATGEAVQSTEVGADNRDRLSDRVDPDNSPPAGESGPPSWTKDVDWAKMSPEEAIKLGSSRMQNSFLEKGLMGIASMANPMLGLGATGIVNASNIKDVKNSIASLNAAGNTAAAEALQKSFNDSLQDKGPGWGWISSIIEGKPFGSTATTTPATGATTAPGTVPSVPSGGVSNARTGSVSGVSGVSGANERSDKTDSFSANTPGATGTVSGTNRGTSETRTGVTSDGAYGTSRTTGSAAPSSSPRPERSPSSSAQNEYEKAASAMSQGAKVGLQKGGLVQKPKPKKAAPKRKTKI